MMYDKAKIITGLFIFAGIVSFPFFYNLKKPYSKPEPSLNTPVISNMSKRECVREAKVMRAYHMQLLKEWRDSVVQRGNRKYGVIDGVFYEKSLERTCMKCHSNKKSFCDRCHSYVNIKPDCFNCHIVGNKKAYE